MVWIALAIAVSVLVGYRAELRWPDRAGPGSRRSLTLLLYFVLPPVIFINLARTDFDFGLGLGLGLGLVSVCLVTLVAWLIAVKLLDLDRPVAGAVICCSVISNTGYLGYPLVLALMGGDDLSQAVAYDVVVSGIALVLIAFGVGAAFGTRAGEGFRARLRTFFVRNPLLYAAILGIIAPSWMAPQVLVEISWVLVALILPVGFFAVGAVLADEAGTGRISFPPPLGAPVLSVVFTRLALSPALLFLLALPFSGIPRSFFLLAAMPAGLNSMIVGHAYGLDLKTTAGALVWTPGIVVLAGLAWTVLA